MKASDFKQQIGENLRKYRKLRALSQGALAKALGVDNSYISSLESGTRNPSINTLHRLASALGISASLLMELSRYDEVKDEKIMPYRKGLIASKKKEWEGKQWYHQRFDGAPYFIHMIAEAQITTRRDQKYGLFFNRHFCFFADGKADWYIDTEEIRRVTNTILGLAHTYPSFSKKLLEEYKPFDDVFYAACRDIEKENLHALSDRELVRLHDRFVQKILDRNSSSSIIDGFALGTDRLLEEKLKKAYDKQPQISKTMRFSEVFSTLTTPSHSSFVRDAELDLLKLVLDIRVQKGNKTKLIREYRDRYFWIRNNYVDVHVLSVAYFEEEIGRIETSGLDVAAEIKRIKDLPNENKQKRDFLLEKLDLDAETLFLLVTTEDFTQWQDERKKATLFTAHYATLVLSEICRRVNLPVDLIKYLSPREVSRIFVDAPTQPFLEYRQNHSVAYWDTEGHEIVSGETVPLINKEVLGEKTIDDVQDFRGMTAALGKAQGRVKILRSAKEVANIEQGDVLVAVMTRPDYVLAMKKAAAIVTDEGGITSHAAIVSRELRIPCVIGTKIATQVLRDGDLVEVNANHGLVKILQRAPRA